MYYGLNIAAAAVDANKAYHATQQVNAYAWLGSLSALIPIQNISVSVLHIAFIGTVFGLLLLNQLISMQIALLIIVGCYVVCTLYAFIKLPVKFNARSRAIAWIKRTGKTNYFSHEKTEKSLRLAASTHVIAAIFSLATFLY